MACAPRQCTLRRKAGQYDEQQLELAILRQKTKRFDELRLVLPELEHNARRYEALKPELPALRYQAKRYGELKDQIPNWRARTRKNFFTTERHATPWRHATFARTGNFSGSIARPSCSTNITAGATIKW